MTKGEEEAELYANTPKWNSGSYDRGNEDKQNFVEGNVLLKGLPGRQGLHLMNGWVRRPSSTPWMGKLRHEATRRLARGLAERSEADGEPEARILSGWCSNHGLPPPRPCDGVDNLRLRLTPCPGSRTSPQVPRTGSKHRGPKRSRRDLQTESVESVRPSSPTWRRQRPSPHPPASLRAGGFPSGPSSGREDDPSPPAPFSPLPLLAEGITYPTWLTAAARSPHSPPRTRNTRPKRRSGRRCTEVGAAGWARLRGLGSQSEDSGRYHGVTAGGVVLY